MSAAMTAKNETASTVNGDAMPTLVIRTPASAGPIARLMLMPMLFNLSSG
jgi:hypothetical protein